MPLATRQVQGHTPKLLTSYMYHRLLFTTKFSLILKGLNRSRDAIVFVRRETLSAHCARPRKTPGWIELTREKIPVNKRACKRSNQMALY